MIYGQLPVPMPTVPAFLNHIWYLVPFELLPWKQPLEMSMVLETPEPIAKATLAVLVATPNFPEIKVVEAAEFLIVSPLPRTISATPIPDKLFIFKPY